MSRIEDPINRVTPLQMIHNFPKVEDLISRLGTPSISADGYHYSTPYVDALVVRRENSTYVKVSLAPFGGSVAETFEIINDTNLEKNRMMRSNIFKSYVEEVNGSIAAQDCATFTRRARRRLETPSQ